MPDDIYEIGTPVTITGRKDLPLTITDISADGIVAEVTDECGRRGTAWTEDLQPHTT